MNFSTGNSQAWGWRTEGKRERKKEKNKMAWLPMGGINMTLTG